jgi:hypothetical protein
VGGTDATTVSEAIANLEGLSYSDKNIPNGVAVLGLDSKVKPENIPLMSSDTADTIDGKINEVVRGASLDIMISNYDSKRTYDLAYVGSEPPSSSESSSPMKGTVILHTFDNYVACMEEINSNSNGQIFTSNADELAFNSSTIPMSSSTYASCKLPGTITFTAPDFLDASGFTLNGRLFASTIIEPYYKQCVILHPTNNSINYRSGVVVTIARSPWITISADAVPEYGYDYAEGYDCELAEDPNFTLNVQTIHLDNQYSSNVRFGFDSLEDNKLYYARVRVNFSGITNDWSNTVSFMNSISPEVSEIQILQTSTLYFNERFASSVDLSNDDNLLVVGVPGGKVTEFESAPGSVHIYSKQVDNTYLRDTIVYNPLPDNIANSDFGAMVKINIDKTHIIVGMPRFDSDNNYNNLNDGSIAVLKCVTPGDWSSTTNVQVGMESAANSDGRFGAQIVISRTSPNFLIASSNTYGHVYIYEYDTTLNQSVFKATLIDPQDALHPGSAQYGSSIAMNDAGTRLFIGAKQALVIDPETGNNNTCGLVYVYDLVGPDWVQTAILEPDDILDGYQKFGSVVACNPEGTELFIGDAPNSSLASIYVFELNTNTSQWVKTQAIQPDYWETSHGSLTAASFSQSGLKVLLSAQDTKEPYPGLSDIGHAYRYEKIDGIWTEMQILTASDSVQWELFGSSVVMNRAGTMHIVGSSNANGDVGCAYVFA